jgi:hypothetical protein
MSEELFFAVFFGFQLEVGCVSKNGGLPYWFCVVEIFMVLLVCVGLGFEVLWKCK